MTYIERGTEVWFILNEHTAPYISNGIIIKAHGENDERHSIKEGGSLGINQYVDTGLIFMTEGEAKVGLKAAINNRITSLEYQIMEFKKELEQKFENVV